jgi:hypothetical protein
MYYDEEQARGWNIFARELQDVLSKYGLKLEQLDDRVGIHREKVRRLVHSLKTPKSFPVLNVDEMEQLTTAVHLAEDDIARLRAALLATSIERLLMSRIKPDDALLAVEQLFPLLLQTLETESDNTSGLGNLRGGETEGTEDSGIDRVLRPVYEALDEGDNVLNLSYDSIPGTNQARYAEIALTYYQNALAALDQLPRDIRRKSQWLESQQNANRGIAASYKRMADI